MRDNDFSGPAFPVQPYEAIAYPRLEDGMSVRDYLAAKAMPVLLTQLSSAPANFYTKISGEQEADLMAKLAAAVYSVADAMLAERAK